MQLRSAPWPIGAVLLSFATAIALAVLAPALAALFLLNESQRHHRLQAFEHLASVTASELDRTLAQIADKLQLLAASPALANNDYEAFYKFAKAAAPHLAGGHLILLDQELHEKINTLMPMGALARQHSAYEVASRARVQRTVAVSDLTTGPETLMGPGSSSWVFAVAVPHVEDGRVWHIVVAHSTTDYLATLLRESLPDNVSARILDRRGLVVAQVLRPQAGGPQLHATRNLSLTGWRVEFAMPSAAGSFLLDWSPWSWVLTGLLVLAVAAGAGWWLARRLSQPIATAAHAAESLGQGPAPPSLKPTGVAEANLLMEALSKASVRVVQRTRALKRARDEARARAREAEEARDEARRRGREAEEARALLHTLLDHVPEGITIVGGPPDYPVIASSRMAFEQLQRSQPLTSGKPAEGSANPVKFYHLDGKTPARQEELPLFRASRLGEVVRDEHWILERGDGSRITCTMNVVPIRDDAGKLIGAINCWRDISAREEEAARLREAITLANVVSAATQAIIFMKDAAGRFTAVNPSCLQLIGRPETEVLGKTVLDLFGDTPGTREIVANDRKVIERGVPIEVEEQVEKDGLTRHYLSNKSPVLGSRGEVVGLVGVSIDITDRKYSAMVDRLVAETDQDLAQLADLNEMMKRAVNRLGKFLGASRCHLAIVSEDGETVTVEPGWLEASFSIDGTHSMSPVLTPEFRAALQGADIIAVADVRTDGRTASRAEAYLSAEIAAFIVKPIIEGGRVRAYLAAHDRRPREWRDHDHRAFHEIATRVWSARSRALTEAALRISEERYRLAAQAIQGMIYDWDFTTGKIERSSGLKELLGYDPDDVPATADWWHSRCHPDDVEPMQAQMRAALGERRSHNVAHYRIRHRDGYWVHVADRGHIIYSSDGTPLREVGSIVNITGQAHAETRLRESEERFRALVEASAQTVWTTNAAGEVEEDSPSWRAFTGQTLLQFLGWGWLDAIHPADRIKVAQQWRAAVAAARPSSMEYRLRHRTGEWRWTQARAVPLLAPDGGVRSWVAMTTDITDRKKWEEQQRLLLSELSHRVKNVLAVVQAMATRTLSGGRSLSEASDVLIKRLHALSRAHDMLTTRDWQGAPLRAIVLGEFTPFAGRARVQGPDLMIGPRMAQTLALVLHELATNAVKYGALSNAEGQVIVNWSVEGEGDEARFKFEWREVGGPPVGPPQRRGFGTALLNMAISSAPDSPSPVRFEPQGLVYSIDVPLASIT